ncbi:endonuclease/exonuclease/phosphatase family protein [Luteolibacter sp. Populi]|uniref:endonuclease/exonuclease/phosphatase family protein n=1 Tax=Luteolibacter sp. Populi TaxID=3230487 RepID=UPI003467E21C
MRLLLLLVLGGLANAEPVALRAVAANLTSDNAQSYSPDNGTHSNPEGAGARILKALKPDVVMIQEFNTSIPTRQWVNATFGQDFHFEKEPTKGIPNGVISRFPIAASGVWDDPVLNNREFFWARIRLPGDLDLWCVSVHLHSKSPASRAAQVKALMAAIRKEVPAEALLLLGGDFNTRSPGEPCFPLMEKTLVVPDKPPHDGMGIVFTNKPRNRPYDWVLASPALDRHEVPVKLAGIEIDGGLVFDTRVFEPLDQLPPAQEGDSGLPQMQHMAVVRDFVVGK